MRNLILITLLLVSGFMSAQTFEFACATESEDTTEELSADQMSYNASAANLVANIRNESKTGTSIFDPFNVPTIRWAVDLDADINKLVRGGLSSAVAPSAPGTVYVFRTPGDSTPKTKYIYIYFTSSSGDTVHAVNGQFHGEGLSNANAIEVSSDDPEEIRSAVREMFNKLDE